MPQARPAKRRLQSEAPATPSRRRKIDKRGSDLDALEQWEYQLKQLQRSLKKELAAMPSSDRKGKARARSPFVETTLPFEYKDYQTRGGRYAALWVRLEYKNHFPAYLLNFYPAKSYDEKDEWEILIHPGAKAGVSPRRFPARNIVYRMDEKAATCTLGIHSSHDIPAKVSNAATRANTPPLNPTASSEEFARLAMDEQLILLRPHLQSIIDETYAPAQWRNNGFFSPRRRAKLDEHKLSGGIRQNEMLYMVTPELSRWMMRGERWELETRPAKSPKLETGPPSGSDRFNALTPAEKANYIERVLRTEAIIQHRIRLDGPVKLAQAELDRRSSETDTHRDVSDIPDMSTLAPQVGGHPTPSQDIPEAYLRAVVLGSQEEPPDWVLYSLALTALESLRREDDVNVWETVVEELKRCRTKLRNKLGLPDEHEGKEERNRRLLEEAGKRPVFGKEGRMTNMSHFKNLIIQ